jgi:HemY protein
MVDIEEAEGHQGAVREWLGRAARAPRDKAWVADSFISDRWAPVSPSGALDAFVWRTPDERIGIEALEPAPVEAEPPPPAPIEQSAPPPVLSATATTPPAAEPPQTAGFASAAPAPRVGLIIDPASMAPDDPGPDQSEQEGRDFRLYAGE